MNNEKLNGLVGKSFEDLTVEEMKELQGASSTQVDSTPTVVVPISTVELSEATSDIASALSTAALSYLASKIKKCK